MASNYYVEVSLEVDASNATDKVKEVVATHPVVVFSKTTCPFCFELKRTLNTMGVEYAVVEVDKSSSMAAIQKALGEVSKITTVPNLFVAGQSYGGCVDVKARLFHGKLQTVLAPYQTKVPAPEEELKRHSLFYFPETVNGNAVRLASFFTFVHAVLCCIFYRHSATKWAVLALMIDFVARVIYGGTYSLMGAISTVLLSRTAPRFVAGPPKQFAALCGVFFSVFASGLFLGDEPVGGCIVLVLLAGAASLETIFDFCLGCWMFGLAIRFGFVSPSIYRPYLNMREEKVYAYNFTHLLRTFPAEALQNQHLLAAGQTTPTPVDLIRKVRPELEFKLQDIDLIRHTTVDFFAIPMAVATLAFMFQTVSARYPVVGGFDGGYASQVLIVIAVVLGGLFTIMYGARAIWHPQKAIKEWYHPLASNYFSAMNILVILIGLCYIQRNHVGGMTLIWIGAIGQMLLTVFKVSDWVYRRWSEDWESPVLMMIPVGNFIAAIGFGTIHQEYGHHAPNFENHIQYNQLGRLWFGVAMLFALVLFTITLRRTFHDSKVDNRHRVGLWVWLATAAAVGPAYLSVYPTASGAVAAGTDVFYQSTWGIALFFFTILSMGYVRGFFSYTNDLSMWIIPFSLAVFAINTIQYYMMATDGLFLGLAIISGAVACASQSVTAAHTLYMLADGSLWVPKAKWGPVSFLKLTHEAFRFYLPQLEARIGELNALVQANGDEKTTKRLVDGFVTEVADLLTAFDVHSAHEDEVMFPMMRRFFPGLVPDVDGEHESLHATVSSWKALVQEYRETSRANAGDAEAGGSVATVAALGQKVLSTLAADFGAWSTAVQAHLRHEEESITVVARKYLPLELARQATHACFTEVTSTDEWAVMFRFVLTSLPVFQWKIRYIKALVWGAPERAQEIGLIIYRNVDRAMWVALTQELPEIIPRGLAGHQRLY